MTLQEATLRFEAQPGWLRVAEYQLLAGAMTALTIYISRWTPTAPELIVLQTAFNSAIKAVKDALPAA